MDIATPTKTIRHVAFAVESPSRADLDEWLASLSASLNKLRLPGTELENSHPFPEVLAHVA